MTKKILSLSLVLTLTCSLLAANVSAATFSDVDGHWAQATIEELAEKGVINGKDNNTYDPEGSVTRAEFMKLLIATEEAELPAIADGELSDVAEDAWYNPYVYAGLDKGVFELTELESSSFMPDSPADRETVALWAVRLLGLESETTATTFADDVDIANKNAVAAAYENGIIAGDEGTNTFRPNDTLTRAEAAVIIKRVMDKTINDDADAQNSSNVEETSKTEKSDKGKIAFVGIDAVAAEVLGVTEESLADTNHAEELYALLEEAGKVEEFKEAVIQAKTEQYDSARGNTTYTDEELDEKLEGYTKVVNEWDGTTELVVTSGGK